MQPGHYPNSPSRPISRLRNIPEPDYEERDADGVESGFGEVRTEGVRFESRATARVENQNVVLDPPVSSVISCRGVGNYSNVT